MLGEKINKALTSPLFHAGVGLLSIDDARQGPKAALQGALQGRQLQQQAAEQQRLQEERERQKALAQQAAAAYQSGGIGAVVPTLLGDPSTIAAGATLAGKMIPDNTEAPSNVREWQYYNSLTDDEKRQYLAMKRASKMFQVGDVTMRDDPVGGGAVVAGGAPPPVVGGGLDTVGGVPATPPPPMTQAEMQSILTGQSAEKAAAEAAAKQAIEMSGSAFEKLKPVGTAIANIDEAISLLDQGAKTGPIVSMLPSITSASVALDNLQGQMGLDVIGNTTFGALSESELKFALDTALPKKLEPADLKDWLIRKKVAQQKLADYLEEAAVFLGTPGNTIADFINMKKNRGAKGKAPPAGGGQVDQTAIEAEMRRRGLK